MFYQKIHQKNLSDHVPGKSQRKSACGEDGVVDGDAHAIACKHPRPSMACTIESGF